MRVAMVVGVTGVTGTPLAEQLLQMPGWKVYGVSRRAPQLAGGIPRERLHHVPVDVTDSGAIRAAMRACSDVTHVFHCADAGDSESRTRMLSNVLDAAEAEAPDFANINLLQGTNYYGCHLGPFRTPAKETDPRLPGCDFHYSEEDLVKSRQQRQRWTWTAVRPPAVCGYAAGNPLNLAAVLGVYCAMVKELGRPLGFPGTAACFDHLFQVADAGLLARATVWVSTQPQCENQAYNVGNGDWFRWRHLWPRIAAYFGLQPAGPQRYSLPEFLADHRALWLQMTQRYELHPFPYERAPRWAQGDYLPPNSRMACEYDVLSDTLKLRQHGYMEVAESGDMFLRLFDRLRREQVIP